MSKERQWRESTEEHPCCVCGKVGWCSESDDGALAICRRCSEHPSLGPGKERTDRNGDTYHLFRLQPSNEAGYVPPRCSLKDGKGQLAPPDVLHTVYTELLAGLGIDERHKYGMLNRGLTKDHAESLLLENTYRSLDWSRREAARRLIEQGLEQHLPIVPGFFVRGIDDPETERLDQPYWTIAGENGLLIPVRDIERRIVALIVRVDRKTKRGKYKPLSSRKPKKNRHGPSPGSPIHIPLFERETVCVRVTEGPLKADITTQLSGMLTIGLPGVASWRRAAGVLKQLGAKIARVAFDMDARRNLAVAKHLQSLVGHLREHGFKVELEVWDECG